MARRRLPPPLSDAGDGPRTAAESMPSLGLTPGFSRPPVARVAAESAAEAAVRDLSSEMESLRQQGRMVLRLPLEAVDEHYLLRDRMVSDPEDMTALTDSLRSHGQRTPIEVVEVSKGRFGLISGWRRLTALRALATAEPEKFSDVLALVRVPGDVAEAYVAMVEENEIRAGLSYWERGRLVLRATEAGVFADERAALRQMFASASRAKRSKIGSFIALVRALDGVLRFPAELPERAGLALEKALEADQSLVSRLRDDLLAAPAETGAQEQARIASLIAGKPAGKDRKTAELRRTIAPGLWIEARAGGVTVGGTALAPELIARLEMWLRNETQT